MTDPIPFRSEAVALFHRAKQLLDPNIADPIELAAVGILAALLAIDEDDHDRAWDTVEQDQSERFERSLDPHAVDAEDPDEDDTVETSKDAVAAYGHSWGGNSWGAA